MTSDSDTLATTLCEQPTMPLLYRCDSVCEQPTMPLLYRCDSFDQGNISNSQGIIMSEKPTVPLPQRRDSFDQIKAQIAALPCICRDSRVPLAERGFLILTIAFLPLLFVLGVLFALPFLDVRGELIWLGFIAGNMLSPLLSPLSLAFITPQSGRFFSALPFYSLATLILAAPLIADIVLPLVHRFGEFAPMTVSLCGEAACCWALTLGLVLLAHDGWLRLRTAP
jgi:hypothetical protein